MNQTAKHIIFSGRVQGVGFRFTAFNKAVRHHLTGFVRNLRDGTVEMVAQGHAEDVDSCIKDIEEALNGYITDTKTEEIAFNPQYENFKITF